MVDWRYGDSWERHPIAAGEIWTETGTGSAVAVADLFDGLPAFMTQADMIYVDPPWNTGNVGSFYTKAGTARRGDFDDLLAALLDGVATIQASVCYMEMGRQNLGKTLDALGRLYPTIQYWLITYYRRNPSYLIRGGPRPATADFTGSDDMDTPRLAMQSEMFTCVADLCMGRGLTATTAYQLGKRFVGTELNPRRLACAIDKVAQLGGDWCITQR